MTTDNDVRSMVEALEPEFTAAKLQVAVAQARLAGVYAQRKVFQGLCHHHNGYKTSCMGDSGFHCPDCKYSR